MKTIVYFRISSEFMMNCQFSLDFGGYPPRLTEFKAIPVLSANLKSMHPSEVQRQAHQIPLTVHFCQSSQANWGNPYTCLIHPFGGLRQPFAPTVQSATVCSSELLDASVAEPLNYAR
jgi:hypothetical protein